MQNSNILKQINKLNLLIKKTDKACSKDLELQAEWAKYICILSAGLLENALKEIYVDFTCSKVPRPVANYVTSTISTIRNPKPQRFLEITAAFNEKWKDNLEKFIADNGRADAIESIMNNRHKIAHGQHLNSTISLVNVKIYLEKSIEVLEFIEKQCKC